jgi:hypothetical protein
MRIEKLIKSIDILHVEVNEMYLRCTDEKKDCIRPTGTFENIFEKEVKK